MSGEAQVVVRFVKPSLDAPVSSVFQEAYEVIGELGADSVWFAEGDCFKVKVKEKKHIYIFEDFKGQAFEHITSTGNKIYGPVCVLHCMKKGKALPLEPHPVYNMSMHGLVISCTSIEKDKREPLHNMVQWMSGKVCKDFHQNITHLVAGEVGSKKYMVAVKLKKKIMSPEWVDKVWASSRESFLKADDPSFDQYRCPLFKGHVITVSGLDSNERGQIKEVVQKEGGKYSGEMKMNECTHLVINVPRGQKYEVAKQWRIHIVTPRWLFESLEAGYCLEEAGFPVRGTEGEDYQGRGHSTSTPTAARKSTGNISEMPDVSVISMTHVNDTNMTMMQNTTVASLRNQTISNGTKSGSPGNQTVVSGNQSLLSEDDPLADLDLNKTISDLFLDGCKIFLSGFKGTRLERVRKIINLGGGTRFNQINESISHVVMGERVPSHVEQLEAATFRPHVVSVQWLVACFRAGECVSEDSYQCLDLPTLDPTTPKAKLSRKSLSNTSKLELKKTGSVSEDVARKPPPGVSTPQAPPAPQDMDELLSQYLPENTSKDTMGESTLMRAAEMGEAANQMAAISEPTNQNKEPVPSNQAAPDMDMTVDPDATMDPEGEMVQLFRGKRFVILGFEPADDQQMGEFIKEAGGQVLQSNTRKVPDYAIVPLFGYPVSMTVGDVATNAWLQICIEHNEILPLESDPIYQPIDVIEDANPLHGCVLSVSGYKGTERDVIIHMAKFLGATVQDYFVKRANAAKKLLVSTHLVVDVAEGSKYTAAKKWNLPAVTKHWVIQCAQKNKRLAEEEFFVDNVPEPPEEEPNQGQSSKVMEALDPDRSGVSRKSVGRGEQEIEDVPMETEQQEVEGCPDEDVEAMNNQEQDVPQAETNEQMQTDPDQENMPQHRTPEYHESQKENRRRNRRSESSTGTADVTTTAKPVLLGKTHGILDTPGNKNTILSTPKNILNPRVRKLVAETRTESPKLQKSPSNTKRDVDSPSKFLDPNVSFHANFDLTDAMASLQSPATPRTPLGTKKSRKDSLSLEEVINHHLDLAVKNTSKESQFKESTPFSQRVRSARESQEEEEEDIGPLRGVIIAVSKKLSTAQSEYNNIAASLGADYRWTYDRSCTHFIFQGRLNDPNKEFRVAKDQGKIIVSPHWLLMCQEQNCRVDENLFPHTYNPNLSLAVTPARTTRTRSTRSSRLTRKNNKSTDSSTSEPEAGTSKKRTTPRKVDKIKDKKLFESLDTTQSDEEIANVCEEAEDEVKETNTQAFVKDLKTLMAATKNYSNRNKRTGRRTESVGKSDDNDSPALKRGRLSAATRQDNETPAKKDRRGSRASRSTPRPEVQSEVSQMVEVSWDDPIARQHQKMLAHDLAKNSESLSPNHIPGDHHQMQPAQHDGEDQDYVREATDMMERLNPKDAIGSHGVDERVPTPEAPSIAFPLPRTTGTISPPKPVELKEEDMEAEREDEQMEEQPRVFLLSGMAQNERDDYGALVEGLGGVLLDAAHYDPSCTHLVVGKPSRNEKFLASVAAGKWVLHKSYFEACRQEGHFVKEEPHEWGSDHTSSIVQGAGAQVTKLAEAAHVWRRKLTDQRGIVGDCGAFDNWHVLLLTDKRKEDGFRRLLEAGGGKVIATRPPFSNLDEITHAFIDMAKIQFSVDVELFVRSGIHCVKPEYIAAFLMDQPFPEPQQYYLPEAAALLKSTNDHRKRKASGTEAPQTPTSKRSKR